VALCAVLTARADYSSTVQSFNPVAYWHLNETTPVPVDAATNSGSLGAAVDGVYFGAAAHPVPGAIGSDTAANFPSAGRVVIPWNAALNPSGPFTVECWANSAAASGTCTLVQSMIQGQNPANGNDRSGWTLREIDGDLQFLVGTTSGNPYYETDVYAVGVVSAGVWQHVAAVYNGTAVSLFVNGVMVTNKTLSFSLLVNFAGPTMIGERGYTGWNFNGDIDEVAIYPTALNATTVKAHYDAASANPAGYAALILAANPVAYYRLNEPAFVPVLPTAVNAGSLGTSADGTYQVGTATQAAGPPYSGLGAGNRACLFKGTGYIDCGDPAGLNLSGPMSVMAWIRVNTFDKDWQAIVTKGDNSWRFHRNSNTGKLGFGTSGLSNLDLAGTRDVTDGVWHHVAAVYSGSTKSLYVDGVLDASVPATGTIDQNTYSVLIGENAQVTGRLFNGTMDELAIFTNALSASQILQAYHAANVPPVITQQPQPPAGTVYEGMTVSLSVAAVGDPPLAYQWTKNGAAVSGKTSTGLVLVNVATNDSGNYAVVLTNVVGAVTSSVVALAVQAGPPVIFQQPQPVTATRYAGGIVTFKVVAGGSVPISYQWLLNGTTPVPGGTNVNLTLTNVQLGDAGSYSLRLTNPYGTTNSATATLTVVPVTNYAAAVMAGNPLVYLRLNETTGTTAYDFAGGFNGTFGSGVTPGVAGPVQPAYLGLEAGNTAFDFNGSSGSVGLPPLLTSNNFMTIVCWIKPTGAQVDQAGLVICRTATWSAGFLMNYNNDQTLHYLWDGDSWTWNSGLAPIAGQWNFAAMVLDPAKATLYLDDGSGLQSASHSTANTPKPFDGSTYVGQDPGYGRWFSGTLDEVAIYNRALAPGEIQNLREMAFVGPTPPAFVELPQSRSTYAGGTASFKAQVTGAVPLTYQWLHAGTNLPGATGPTLTLANVSQANAGNYVLRVTNPVNSTNSPPATLTVLTPAAGTYAASVLGNGLIGYWRFNEPNGSTTAFDWFGLSDATVETGVTMGAEGVRPPAFRGFEAGNLAALFDGSTPASIAIPPQNLTLNTATFTCWLKRAGDQPHRAGILHQRSGSSVLATGLGFQDSPNNNQLSYNWNDAYAAYAWNPGFTPPDGEWAFVAVSVTPSNATLYLGTAAGLVSAVNTIAHTPHDFSRAPIEIGRDNYQAPRVFNGQMDEVTFHAQALSPDQIATLYASAKYAPTDPPVITQQPASLDVLTGSSATFSLTAVGGVPWTYQWRHNGADIAGATTRTHAIPNAYFTDVGAYQAVVRNAGGSATSTVATLLVEAPPAFANLTNGLVLHLKFDGDYLDASGRGNNGTRVGTPTFVPGKLSQALHYNTDNTDANNVIYNFVTLQSPADLQFGTSQNFSVSYWIRFTGNSLDLPVLCNNDCGEGCIGYFFGPAYYVSGAWAWSFANSTYAGIDADGAANSINDGQWHNVVSTFDRAGLGATYLDGVLVDARPITGFTDSLDTANPVNVGQVGTGDYKVKFGADVDDLGVWQRVLSSAEAASIYVVGQNYGRSFDTYGPVMLTVRQSGTDLELIWQAGTLQAADAVDGTYLPVGGATAPYYKVTPAAAKKFYRVRL